MTANAIMPNVHRSIPARIQGRGRNGTELCQARWKPSCLWDCDATPQQLSTAPVQIRSEDELRPTVQHHCGVVVHVVAGAAQRRNPERGCRPPVCDRNVRTDLRGVLASELGASAPRTPRVAIPVVEPAGAVTFGARSANGISHDVMCVVVRGHSSS